MCERKRVRSINSEYYDDTWSHNDLDQNLDQDGLVEHKVKRLLEIKNNMITMRIRPRVKMSLTHSWVLKISKRCWPVSVVMRWLSRQCCVIATMMVQCVCVCWYVRCADDETWPLFSSCLCNYCSWMIIQCLTLLLYVDSPTKLLDLVPPPCLHTFFFPLFFFIFPSPAQIVAPGSEETLW